MNTVRSHRPLASRHHVESDVQTVTKNDREYLVFPLVALREMVIDYPENGTQELLHRDEIQASVDLWAGTPLTYVHPENDSRSAADPDAYTTEVIGQVFDPEIVDDEKLRVQAWLDVAKAESLGGLATDVVDQLRAGTRLSVSAGYATYNDDFSGGEHNGESYNLRQGALVPDHVAIFPSDEFQARCDWEDGCGAPRANAATEAVTNAEGADRFDNPQDALDRATDLGCEGVHWHEDADGDVQFMPCQSHAEWAEATDRTNAAVGDYVRLPNGSEPYGRVVEVVADGTRRCGSRVLQTTDKSDDRILMVAVDDFERPVAHYASSLERWSDTEVETVTDTSTSTGKSRTNVQAGQYVQWDWSGGTAYGQVIERVTEPDTCRSVNGNERCASAERNVVVLGHLSEDGETQAQRVVKYEDNVSDWDAPDEADSLNTAYRDDAVLTHALSPQPLDATEAALCERVTNVTVDGESVDLTPPDDVQAVAQDFLDAQSEGLIGDGCGTNDPTSTGYERAEQLASASELTTADIMAPGSGMYGWFARHGAQENQAVDMRERPADMSEREFKYQNCGYAAWRAWGGDPAQEWVDTVHDEIVAARSNAMWQAGQLVEFQMFDARGVVVHNPEEEPDIVMVELVEPVGPETFERSGRTVTAGPDDLLPYEGPRTVTNSTEPSLLGKLTQALGFASESGADAGDDAVEPAAEALATDTQQTSQQMNTNTNDDDTRENAALEPEQIAKHTIFTEEMLAEMGEEMLDTIEDQLLKEMVDNETNSHGDDMGETYEEEQQMTENYVTDDELDERLSELEASLTETVENAIAEQESVDREAQARQVANAIAGLTPEAAAELPADELDRLAEQHVTRSNYAGVPGTVERQAEPEADGPNVESYPAGGRSNYESRGE